MLVYQRVWRQSHVTLSSWNPCRNSILQGLALRRTARVPTEPFGFGGNWKIPGGPGQNGRTKKVEYEYIYIWIYIYILLYYIILYYIYTYIFIYRYIYILVGGLEHDFYEFPYIGNNNPNWLASYFSEGLKPPAGLYTGYWDSIGITRRMRITN